MTDKELLREIISYIEDVETSVVNSVYKRGRRTR